MAQVQLDAARRTGAGKGVARALRREGKVPAVIYGHGREPESLVLDGTAYRADAVGHHDEPAHCSPAVTPRPAKAATTASPR